MYERYIKRGLDVIFAVIALPIVLVVCIIFDLARGQGNDFLSGKEKGKRRDNL